MRSWNQCILHKGRLLCLTALLTVLAPLAAGAQSNPTLDEMFNNENPTDVQDESPADSEETNEEESKGESLFFILVKFLLSFLLIVALLFIFLKFLANRTKSIQSKGPIQLLGGCSFGSNRSMQVVQVGNTLYIMGVGEDVRLVREITEADEDYEQIMGQIQEQRSVIPGGIRWPRWLKRQQPSTEDWDDVWSAKIQEMKNHREEVESWLESSESEERKNDSS